MKSFEELSYVFKSEKIDKSVAHITIVMQIDWQVKKIEFILKFSVHSVQHLFLRVFVWNVSDHNSLPPPRLYFL